MVHLTSPNTLYIYIIIVVLIAFATAMVSYMSINSSVWYNNVQKPEIANHGIIFTLIWTTLYLLMVVGGYYGDIATVEKRSRSWVIAVRVLFGVQLVLSLVWAVLFFGMGAVFLALIVSILIVGTIIALMVLYIQVSELAFWVFVPILVWHVAAFFMTLWIWRMNRMGCGEKEPACGCGMPECTCPCKYGTVCMCASAHMMKRMNFMC